MRRLWISFTLVMIFSFVVLGWIGVRIYQEAPPLPDRVLTTAGTVVIDRGEIASGQNVRQSLGGMEVGSIWGHGSYVAPDWRHREAVYILNRYAADDFGKPYHDLSGEQQAQLRGRLAEVNRKNTYNAATGDVTIDPIRRRLSGQSGALFRCVFPGARGLRNSGRGGHRFQTLT